MADKKARRLKQELDINGFNDFISKKIMERDAKEVQKQEAKNRSKKK